MEIEKQVCTLEQAERLKDLGVKQNGYFWWSWYGQSRFPNWEVTREKTNEATCCAFTVAELGEMLPEGFYSDKEDFKWEMMQKDDDGKLEEILELGVIDATELFNTEAQARANLLIHLLESKTITATEVNERK